MRAASVLFLVVLTGQGGAASFWETPDPAKQVIALQEAIRREPDTESHYTELGNLLLQTQNFREAILVLEAARPRFPASAQVMLSLGVAYYGQRRFPDAVGALVEAGRRDPDAPQPIAFLTRIREHWTGRTEDVHALMAAFAERHPRSGLAQFALGRATGDAARLKQAIALEPRMAEAHFELGEVLEAQRDWPGAIAAFRDAARLAPGNPVPHYKLSGLYARTGDAAKAAEQRALHEKLAAAEKAEMDRRQAATKHLKFGGSQP